MSVYPDAGVNYDEYRWDTYSDCVRAKACVVESWLQPSLITYPFTPRFNELEIKREKRFKNLRNIYREYVALNIR